MVKPPSDSLGDHRAGQANGEKQSGICLRGFGRSRAATALRVADRFHFWQILDPAVEKGVSAARRDFRRVVSLPSWTVRHTARTVEAGGIPSDVEDESFLGGLWSQFHQQARVVRERAGGARRKDSAAERTR